MGLRYILLRYNVYDLFSVLMIISLFTVKGINRWTFPNCAIFFKFVAGSAIIYACTIALK